MMNFQNKEIVGADSYIFGISKKLFMPKESFLGIKVCTGKNHTNIQYGALIRDQLLLYEAK